MRRAKLVLKLGTLGLLTASLASGWAVAQPPREAPNAAPAAHAGSAVIVAINGTQRLSLSSKKNIRSVVNEKEAVARVQALATEQNAVMVIGLTAGSTQVTLTDVDGKAETFDVLVQLDIDAIKSVIRYTFPTANITPIPAGNNTIVLTGNVAHPEDVEPILRVARGVLGSAGQGMTEVYNAMTVGGVRQVQLDVTIAQVNRTEARRRNASWVVDGTTVSFASLLPGMTLPSSASSVQAGLGVGARNASAIAVPLISTGTSGANIIFGVVPANFNMLIQALRTEGLAKLLAEPKLVTMSGHPATFLSGGQQAILSPSSGITGPGVVLQDVGTALTFLPIVYANGKIFLEVTPEVRGVDNGKGINTTFGFTPGFTVQRVSTRVTMEAGQTFAIGGLIQTETQTSSDKVPLLGDLPFVGLAFSSIATTDVEQELVILVTPYLVDPMDCKQAPCKLPGNETRKPDDFELFLETILEAPRGQREVFPDRRYAPAWKSDATADKLPCGGDRGGCASGKCGTQGSNVTTTGNGGCANGGCANGGCANGNCGSVQAAPPAPTTVPPVNVTVGNPTSPK